MLVEISYGDFTAEVRCTDRCKELQQKLCLGWTPSRTTCMI
ncbi:hypothetical protein [Turicimonas muris]